MSMMGGPMSGWMIALMVFGGLLSLLVVAAIVFVLIAAGCWLWFRGGPSGSIGSRPAPPS